MQNVNETILAQYANSPSLCTIIDGFNQAVDPAAAVDAWYDSVWNPRTATGWGLDVWGRIVGVSRILSVPDAEFFGFSEASPTALTFGQGIFYSGTNTSSSYATTDDVFRNMIFAKAAANLWDGSITGLNAVMMTLFGDKGRSYATDNQDMTMTYVFEFSPTDVDRAIIASGILPRPSGVSVAYIFTPFIDTDTDFGGDIL